MWEHVVVGLYEGGWLYPLHYDFLRCCLDSIGEGKLSSLDWLFNYQGITQGNIWWYGIPMVFHVSHVYHSRDVHVVKHL